MFSNKISHINDEFILYIPQRINTGTGIPGRLLINTEEEREIYREIKKKAHYFSTKKIIQHRIN